MKKLKYILTLLLITLFLGSCGTTARLTSIEEPSNFRDVKIQKKSIKVLEDYTKVKSKKGSQWLIYHHIYYFEVIN